MIVRGLLVGTGTRAAEFPEYQNDPVGFGQKVLGEHYTDGAIEVMHSVRDNIVTLAKSGNALGKTHVAARIAVWRLKCFPQSQVYTAAAPPLENLTRLLWGEIGGVTNNHPALFENNKVGTLHILKDPQSFIVGVAIPAQGTEEQREAKFSGKHAPNLLFIIDEGDAVPNEVYKGIESCMSGGQARLLILYNPRGAYGPVYQMEKARQGKVIQLTAFNHPNVTTGEDLYPGAVTRAKTLQRINEWTRPLAANEKPDKECFEVPAFLVGETTKSKAGDYYEPLKAGWRKIVNPQFSYMVMAEYPSRSEFQLISQAAIDAAQSRWKAFVAQFGEIPQGIQPVMGMDAADGGPDNNAVCFRYGGFVAPIETWNGIDVDMSGTEAINRYNRRKARIAKVDATGVGAGIPPKMRRAGCKAQRVMVGSSPTSNAGEEGDFGCLRDQLYWEMAKWINTDPGAMLPPDDPNAERLLGDQLIALQFEVVHGVIRVTDKASLKSNLGYSPDEMEALLMTFAPEDAEPVISLSGQSQTMTSIDAILAAAKAGRESAK